MRARYYNPADGRFITKDPSGVESNLYLYGKANPINRIDPSGLYSGAMIEKNINLSEFFSHGFMDETNHERFGFYALLRKAQDFDYIQVGSLNLQSMYPDVSFSSGEAIWSINCETIMVGGQTLNQYFHNVVKRQRYPSIWWRDTSAMFYDLFSISTYPNSRRSFADGTKNGNIAESDVPQFRALSLGAGKDGELQLIVDINGAFHLAYSYGFGRVWGLSYLEGYVCTSKWSECFYNETPSPSDAAAAIDGLCWSNELILIGGINISPFCYGGGNLSDASNWSNMSTFSIGAEVGAGTGGSLTLPLSLIGVAPKPTMGWKWTLDDYINGVTYEDILAYRTEP